MNKAEIYDLLRTRGIWHEITEHKAVYNMAELTDVALPYPEADAKNLFVRDDKKRNYYLITVRGDKRVDLKEFRHRYGTRALSFASENDLMQVLGLIPGAVTPLGLLNDAECKVQLYLDEAFFAQNPMAINCDASVIWSTRFPVRPLRVRSSTFQQYSGTATDVPALSEPEPCTP